MGTRGKIGASCAGGRVSAEAYEAAATNRRTTVSGLPTTLGVGLGLRGSWSATLRTRRRGEAGELAVLNGNTLASSRAVEANFLGERGGDVTRPGPALTTYPAFTYRANRIACRPSPRAFLSAGCPGENGRPANRGQLKTLGTRARRLPSSDRTALWGSSLGAVLGAIATARGRASNGGEAFREGAYRGKATVQQADALSAVLLIATGLETRGAHRGGQAEPKPSRTCSLGRRAVPAQAGSLAGGARALTASRRCRVAARAARPFTGAAAADSPGREASRPAG